MKKWHLLLHTLSIKQVKHILRSATNLLFLLAVIGIVASFFVGDDISLGNATYRVEGQDPVPFTYPLKIERKAEFLTIETDLYLGFPFTQTLRIIPDDCLEQLWVNGKEVQSDKIPFCPPYQVGEVYDLSKYLRIGKNHLTIRLRDTFGFAQLQIKTEAEYSVPTRLVRLLLGTYLFFFILIRLK